MFACIYVPNFSLAAVLRAEPELRARTVAVLEGNPPLEKLIALNAKAAASGIAAGMTRAQAELSSGIVLRSRSASQETSAHAALLDCAQSFSPLVEDAAHDTALIDLAGMESLLGPLPEIAANIHARAAVLGLDVNVAVASNADAAMVAARGFSGITTIPCGNEAERLGPLPVKVLFTSEWDGEDKEAGKKAGDCLETFERWGVRNLRGLAALPADALSQRMGQEGLRLQCLARGASSRPLNPMEAPVIFEELVELEHAIVLLEPLAFLLNRLLEQVCARLGARALATQELRLKLELETYSAFHQSEIGSRTNPKSETGNRKSKTCFCRTLRLPLPMLDTKLFLKLLQLELSSHPPGAPIVKIHLAAEPARPRSAQAGLFLPPSPEPEKLELTIARIAGMVGQDRVGAVELVDTHHPEGFRIRHFVSELARESRRGRSSKFVSQKTSAETKSTESNSEKNNREKSAVTALRRFRPPLRAAVSLENGQPTRLICEKAKEVSGAVLWRAGPWRSSGDWWERVAWSRDEWDIALQNNALQNNALHSAGTISLYRLVHDLLGGGWFVEGTYD